MHEPNHAEPDARFGYVRRDVGRDSAEATILVCEIIESHTTYDNTEFCRFEMRW